MRVDNDNAGKPRSAAVICFIPDYGHAQPLLKMADALAAAGFEIKCYLPDECSPLMDRFRFQCMFFENMSLSQQKRKLAKIFARSLFFNSVCSYVHYLLCYPRLAMLAASAAQKLQSSLREQAPDVLLCDQHWFIDWYVRIAASLDIPLMINSFDGSLAYNQRSFVRTYGMAARSAATQRVVEIAAAVCRKLCPFYYRLRHFLTWLEVRAGRRAGDAAFAAAFPVLQTDVATRQYVSIGNAAIERDRLAGVVRTAGANRREFPPLRFRSHLRLPERLREWIESEPGRSIVYVSFGSAVEIDRRFAVAIYEGLREISVRVLWSLPADQQVLLSDLPAAEGFRFERFVPQPEILAVGSVRCFITQAGPWSVQEALFGGTPMLCIPFYADQAYNSAVVEHLRVGRRLWRRRVSARSVKAAVQEILADEAFHLRAVALRGDLLRNEGGQALARHVTELVRSRVVRDQARRPKRD